jgi:hypothetical protein
MVRFSARPPSVLLHSGFAHPADVPGSMLKRFCRGCAADAGVSRLPGGGAAALRIGI